MKESIKAIFKEIKRLWVFILVSVLLLLLDDSSHVIIFVLGTVTFVVLAVHLIRKLLFPYVDIKVLVDEATKNPLAAAIIVASMLYLISSVITSVAAILR